MMALHGLVSAGGSPGVTTAAIALAFTWPRTVILAECDPAGGDVMAGLFGGLLPSRSGLLAVAVDAGRDPVAAAAALQNQLIELSGDFTRLLLPGITDPRQAAGLVSAWPALAEALAAQPGDVIADCGRLDPSETWPLPVLAAAATITLVLQPSLRQVSKAKPRVEMLNQVVGAGRLTLLVTGQGRYSAQDAAKALGLKILGTLPHDPKTAAMLTESDGAGRYHRLLSRPLIRAAGSAARALRGLAGADDQQRNAQGAAGAGAAR
jgi:hypothetical protein